MGFNSGFKGLTAAPHVNLNSNKQLQCSLYCIIILSGQYRLSLLAASPTRMWPCHSAVTFHAINERRGSDKLCVP